MEPEMGEGVGRFFFLTAFNILSLVSELLVLLMIFRGIVLF
jgi:hypothetical protein